MAPPPDSSPLGSSPPVLQLEGLSFDKQFHALFDAGSPPLNPRKRLPKPSLEAQRAEPRAERIPGSSVYATPEMPIWVGRTDGWAILDLLMASALVFVHAMVLLAPWTFSWSNLWLCLGSYFLIGCLGIDVSYHRQLTHKSFTSPKWLEYLLAYLGALGMENHPIEWCRHHKFHHLNTDTPMDPHSSYEGFWWSHYGWLLHRKILDQRAGDNWIVSDLASDPFYKFLEKTYIAHMVMQYLVYYWFGGLGAVIWGIGVRQVLLWHITWLVNSACHVWGARPYNTGDLSTNNALLALPSFGESWHNNHHAFPYSARHGLEWWQVDITWMVIRLLQALGLAWDVRTPSEAQKRKATVGAWDSEEQKVGESGEAAEKSGKEEKQTGENGKHALPGPNGRKEE